MTTALATGFLAGAAQPAPAAQPPPDVFNGRIGFTSFRVDHDPGPETSFNGDIFSSTPDGRDVRQLTTDPGYDAQTDWSPDGTTIAYRIRKPGSRINYEIARMSAAGGPRTIITSTPTGLASSMPSWYPDGTGILFRMSGRGTDSDVWRMGTLGEAPALLFSLEGGQWYPSLSPDMTRVLFATTLSPVGDTDRGIFTANPDGTDVRLVYDSPGVMDTGPAWAPDGRRIAFESDSDPTGGNPEGDREIFVIDVDGNHVTQLTHNTDHDEGPAWSPDGSMLVYSGGFDPMHGDIKVMTADGVVLHQVTTFDGRDESPDWQAIPAPATTRACDSVAPPDIRDVRSRAVPCRRAQNLVRRWIRNVGRPPRGRPLRAQVDDFGGTRRVILSDTGRHQRRDGIVAFLWEPSIP